MRGEYDNLYQRIITQAWGWTRHAFIGTLHFFNDVIKNGS